MRWPKRSCYLALSYFFGRLPTTTAFSHPAPVTLSGYSFVFRKHRLFDGAGPTWVLVLLIPTVTKAWFFEHWPIPFPQTLAQVPPPQRDFSWLPVLSDFLHNYLKPPVYIFSSVHQNLRWSFGSIHFLLVKSFIIKYFSSYLYII